MKHEASVSETRLAIKINNYVADGVLVWVVYPEQREVHVISHYPASLNLTRPRTISYSWYVGAEFSKSSPRLSLVRL